MSEHANDNNNSSEDVKLTLTNPNPPIVKKRSSFMEDLKAKTSDQDFQQRTNVFIALLLEIYRVLMGAFLTIFVPQTCGDHSCGMSETINRTGELELTALSFNAITMLTFLFLYTIEVKRENKLITYLDVNRFTPVDDDSVGNCLERLPKKKHESILQYDKYYQQAGYAATGMYLLNAIFSSIVVYSNYLDSTTVTVYITNLLFMALKVADVYSTVNTKKNIFYSAYLKDKIQYNDVDPDKEISEECAIDNND